MCADSVKACFLTEEIEHRLLSRLQLLKCKPTQVLTIGEAGSVSQYYGDAVQDAVMTSALTSHESAQQHYDVCISNLSLQNATASVLSALATQLNQAGFAAMSFLGWQTGKELFRLLGDENTVFNPCHDMQDWSGRLLQAGFHDPILDRECIVLRYKTPEKFRSEFMGFLLRTGLLRSECAEDAAISAAIDRVFGDAASQGVSFSVTLEVIYAHAWKTTLQNKPKMHVDGEFTIDADSISVR